MAIRLEDLPPDVRKQAEAKIAANKGQAPAKPRKYRNIPTTRVMPGGSVYTFQSTKEGKRYDELLLLLKAGVIKDLKLQHNCTLVEGYTTPEGKRIRPEVYKADFTYFRKTAPDAYGYDHWVFVVEDAKGRRTETYKIKAKQFREKYGFDITEV